MTISDHTYHFTITERSSIEGVVSWSRQVSPCQARQSCVATNKTKSEQDAPSNGGQRPSSNSGFPPAVDEIDVLSKKHALRVFRRS